MSMPITIYLNYRVLHRRQCCSSCLISSSLLHMLLQSLFGMLCALCIQSLALLILGTKVDADTVHAMPLILGVAKPLALEDVAQMTSAVVAHNFRPHHAQAGIWSLANSARYCVPKGRPSTARVKLVVRLVERCIAAGARIHARIGVVLVVCARAGHFCALLTEDAELLCDSVRRYSTVNSVIMSTYLVTAVLATRHPSSAPGSLCCPPCCLMIRKAHPRRGCWA
jgi:hypothetical protein